MSKRQLCKQINGCTNVDLTVAQASNRRLHKRQIDDCTSAKLAVVQASIRRLHNRQFDGCTSVDSTIVLTSIGRLQKCWLDECTSVDSMVAQSSNQRLHNRRINGYKRRIDGYIDYFKKSIKIFRCPFSATITITVLSCYLLLSCIWLFYQGIWIKRHPK